MSDLSEPLEVLVLAAGQGKRMASARPKVLHALGGRPLLRHVLDAVSELRPRRQHVVVGHEAAQVRSAIGDAVTWVDQPRPQGTGDAVIRALPGVDADALVLVVYGDVPLIRAESLRRCTAAAQAGRLR